MSGTECLNLNITVPASATNGLMPVMVFIHGGGFLMGANYWAQYDPCRLVELASGEGMPMIIVGVK
jgi:carboxylesterase type B